MLSLLPGQPSAWVNAISDHGLVVGTSTPDPNDFKSSAVLWKNTTTPLDLGFTGQPRAGVSIKAAAVDVNENGAVAVDVARYKAEDERIESAWVWRDNVRTRLRTPPKRSWATVNAINDHGVAVGSVQGIRSRRSQIPVVWRRGTLIRLPLPPGGQFGEALENNNRAVVIGTVALPNKISAWWWRLGGRSGPLRSGRLIGGQAIDIDDRNRIVGIAGQQGGRHGGRQVTVLWRRPRMAPRILTLRKTPVAMNAGGHLVGGLNYGSPPWIARLHGTAASLPLPPATASGAWDDVSSDALAQGVTAFAPQGGVTVAGTAWVWDDTIQDDLGHPTLWTCAQAYSN